MYARMRVTNHREMPVMHQPDGADLSAAETITLPIPDLPHLRGGVHLAPRNHQNSAPTALRRTGHRDRVCQVGPSIRRALVRSSEGSSEHDRSTWPEDEVSEIGCLC
jgi:hypothetical protein